MKQDNLSVDFEDLVDEYDDYQYDITAELSTEFIDATLMPMLDEFDYNNPSEDYVPGMATFGMFTKLIQVLLEEGFTPDQLKESVDEFTVVVVDGTIH